MARSRNRSRTAPEATTGEAPAAPVTGEVATPPAAPEPKVIELKAKRQVTRYSVSFNGVVYDSPRKALDAAGLTQYKGSQVRSVLKDQPVGTVIRIEGKEFKYEGAPAK